MSLTITNRPTDGYFQDPYEPTIYHKLSIADPHKPLDEQSNDVQAYDYCVRHLMDSGTFMTLNEAERIQRICQPEIEKVKFIFSIGYRSVRSRAIKKEFITRYARDYIDILDREDRARQLRLDLPEQIPESRSYKIFSTVIGIVFFPFLLIAKIIEAIYKLTIISYQKALQCYLYLTHRIRPLPNA